ncbi:MAG: hypothetical protein KKE24_00745 [Candidatus Thermoplasmatota archaeon]|nr:hypothetical protein [Candidatus Thermoplasmatota archaeon]
MTRRRPFGVTILAIAQLVSAIQFLFVAFVILAISDSSTEHTGILFATGLVYLAMSVLYFFITAGYLKGRESSRRWGRRAAIFAMIIAVAVISLNGVITDPRTPVLTLILNLFIFIYLGRKKVRSYFRYR